MFSYYRVTHRMCEKSFIIVSNEWKLNFFVYESKRWEHLFTDLGCEPLCKGFQSSLQIPSACTKRFNKMNISPMKREFAFEKWDKKCIASKAITTSSADYNHRQLRQTVSHRYDDNKTNTNRDTRAVASFRRLYQPSLCFTWIDCVYLFVLIWFG